MTGQRVTGLFLSPEASFRRVLQEHHIEGGAIVLGVSGGVDSVCLAQLCVTVQEEFRLQPYIVHVHHGLRGAEADADAAFVRELGAALSVPVTVVPVDVPRAAMTPGVSVEEAARQWRYAVLGREAERVAARWIAVAHHADDQVETVLMHFLRGAGLAGLRGMLPVTWYGHLRLPLVPPSHRPRSSQMWLVRPLLYTTRAAIETWARERNLPYRFDRSNLDTTYFRNRLRHEVLPLLEEINPQIRHALFALAELAAADFALLEGLGREAWASTWRGEGRGWVRFDLSTWRALPLALRRGVIRDAVLYLRRELRDVGFDQVERARSFLEDPAQSAGSECTLPAGLVVRREYTSFLIAEQQVGAEAWSVPQVQEPVVVPGPGVYPLGNGWSLEVRWVTRAQAGEQWRHNPDRWTAFFDADALTWPLTVRPRRTGERIALLGMGGRRTLISDVLANAKVPRWTRGHWPVVVDAQERVLWVAGVRQAEVGRITARTKTLALLKMYPHPKPAGGSTLP